MAATMGSDAAKQIPQAGSQPFGNLFDVDQGQIPHAPLNATVVGSVKLASLSSFFLTDFLLFAQTTDCAAKADADVGHSLQLSSRASDPYTADESHHSGQCSFFVNQTSTLQTLQILMSIRMRACSDFVTNTRVAKALAFVEYGPLQPANENRRSPEDS
jgi:hypothetical protein